LILSFEPNIYVKNDSHTSGPTSYVDSYISGYLRAVSMVNNSQERRLH
jgi:hypothetical protein